MGMDCVPRNCDVEPFRANWSGWHFLERVLHLAGADTSEMAGSNDGHYVRAGTAKVWAKTLKELLERRGNAELRLAKVPDDSYDEGYVRIPVVEREKAPVQEKVFFKLNGTLFSVPDQVRSYLFNPELDDTKISVVGLPNDHKEFILEFAKFCERSGGFEQY